MRLRPLPQLQIGDSAHGSAPSLPVGIRAAGPDALPPGDCGPPFCARVGEDASTLKQMTPSPTVATPARRRAFISTSRIRFGLPNWNPVRRPSYIRDATAVREPLVEVSKKKSRRWV